MGVSMLNDLVNCKVSAQTKDRLRCVASKGKTTESDIIRVLLELGLALCESNPDIVRPLHKLLVKKNDKSMLRFDKFCP